MTNQPSNTLRIIGGVHKGRKLHFENAKGLRPTSDKTRETLFNWLQMDIEGACVLDLFAGSGALGFEAASRGAASVTMLEKNKRLARRLYKNRELLRLDQLHIINMDAIVWLEKQHHKFDIVFLDPPFSTPLLQQAIDRIEQSSSFNLALIYTEQAKRQTALQIPSNWNVLKEKTAGAVKFNLYQA